MSSFKLLSAISLLSESTPSSLKAGIDAAHQLGKTNPAELVEMAAHGFAPSAEDYQLWLDVMTDFANENNININRRSAFLDLVHMMWDNDPAPPPMGSRNRLAMALWSMHKANRAKHAAAAHFPAGEAPQHEPQSEPQNTDKMPPEIQDQDDMPTEEEEIDLNQPQTRADVQRQNKSTVHQDPVDAALTSPKHSLDDRIREYERDGERAWDDIQFVDNPHPRDSLAWKAWNRGHKRRAMSHFNIRVPAPESGSRPASKRKR